MKDRNRATAYGVLAVLIWSTVATAFKITLRYMDPSTMVFISSLISLLSIFLIIMISGDLRSLFRTTRKNVIIFMLLGSLNPFLYYLVLFGGYDRLPAQVAQSINYSWPVILTVLSVIFLGQRIGARSILGVVLGFIGVVVVSTRGLTILGGILDPIGLLLAVSSAVIWAVFWTMNLKVGGKPAIKLFFCFLGGSIPISIMVILSGPEVPALEGLLAVSYVGLFEMGVTFILWLGALSLARNTAKISTLIYLSPFLSLILIGTVLSEPILISTLIGLFLIVTGIMVQRIGVKDESEP